MLPPYPSHTHACLLPKGFYDMRMKFDESDNVVVRGARSFTDNIQERLSGMFEDDESNVVLQEIAKQDPTFDKVRFALHCEKNVIPAVLEVSRD